MAFDPFLYVALGAGVVAGRVAHVSSPWTTRATRATVVVLVGLLGTLLATVPAGSLLVTVPVALAFALLVLAATGGIFLLMSRRPSRTGSPAPAPAGGERIPFSGILVAALVGGFVLGHFVILPTDVGITGALYVLLALVGYDLKLAWVHARELVAPLGAAVLAAVGTAVVLTLTYGSPWPVSFATTFAFGWYTLAGPLVAARAGTVLGLLAFLTNFFRENLTMVLSPYLGRRLRGAGLASLGGATSMDTTLYFVTRYGDASSGTLSLANGLVLTLAAGLLLPVILALPL